MDREDRAAALSIACCFDIASMKLDYAFDDRESEASGAFTRRWSCRQPLEAAEQPRQVILRQARSSVPYLDFGTVRFDRHDAYPFFDAAGEFCGPNGVIGAASADRQ